MTAKTIETKVNSTWKAICQKRHIPKNIQRSYLSSNTDLPQFYHLVKTHKLQQGIKIRPIVSNCYGLTKRLSWLLANLLKPFSKDIPAHLENSLELILNIQTSNQPTNQSLPYPFSLDVVSLYTSIPVSEAIECATNRIHAPIYGLTKEDIKELLNVTLSNTYFQYETKIFLQVSGLPMGSSLSAIRAILFMDKLERKALLSFQYIDPYERYMDDIYTLKLLMNLMPTASMII